MENLYRDYECPGYGDAICPCPEIPVSCEGAKGCAEIIVAVEESWAAWNVNGDS
jgi:hypothetical protein